MRQKPKDATNVKLENEFAKAKYGKEFDKLTPNQRKEISMMNKTKEKSTSLRELANEAAAARAYKEAYVDAYAKLSDKGVGLFGKHNSTIRSLDELKHKSEQAKAVKEAKRKDAGEELYSSFESAKRIASGGKFGRSFDEIDTNETAQNYRMQTYNEMREDRQLDLKYQATEAKIDNLSKAKGENVISPSFLAKAEKNGDPNFAIYKELEKENVQEVVRKNLTQGKNPALKGQKFIEKYAKDSEMIDMIERAEEVKKDLLQEDQFIAREEQYENKVEIVAERILDKKEVLEAHFGNIEITEQAMPAMLEQYNKEKGLEPEINKQEVLELQESIEEFKSAQETLQKIDERKELIIQEVDKHVTNINKARTKAQMKEYIPPKKPVVKRPTRKIEELRRGGRK